MSETLANNEMVKLLEQKNGKNVRTYIGILELIEKPVDTLLSFIKTNFPGYTDHSLDHSYRILEYLYNILSEEQKEDLSAAEIFCLILASMFHDMGMGNPDEEDKVKVRMQHGCYSSQILDKFLAELKIVENIERIKRCVGYICESHTKELHQFYSEQMLNNTDMFAGEKVRYGYLAILLRIGDLMDMEEARTCYMVHKVFPAYLENDTSKAHHMRHKELINYCYDSEKIEVTVRANTQKNFMLWTEWLTFLDEEILWANSKYLIRNKIKAFPSFSYDLKPAPGAGFQTEEIRFEIDDKGTLWNIIAQSVYTNDFDYVLFSTLNDAPFFTLNGAVSA